MLNSLDKLLRINEAAPYLGRRRTTIYDLINSGELKAVRVGGRVFIRESEIKRFQEVNARPIEPKRASVAA